MLVAFTQHPIPSDFSRSPSVTANMNSAGPFHSQDFAVDLTLLQNSVVQRLDPNRLLCRFESSGAGKCQDRYCEDYHWSDLEPPGELIHLMVPAGSPQVRLDGLLHDSTPFPCFVDDMLAQYLLESVPGLAIYNHGEIKGVIQSTRTMNVANMGLSTSTTASHLQTLTDLVTQALRSLLYR
jgi:hypothetical protein